MCKMLGKMPGIYQLFNDYKPLIKIDVAFKKFFNLNNRGNFKTVLQWKEHELWSLYTWL